MYIWHLSWWMRSHVSGVRKDFKERDNIVHMKAEERQGKVIRKGNDSLPLATYLFVSKPQSSCARRFP